MVSSVAVDVLKWVPVGCVDFHVRGCELDGELLTKLFVGGYNNGAVKEK